MTKIENGTWVLIADGEKALFMVNETDGEDPFLQVFREEEQDNPPNRDQAANRRGRFNDGPSVHRSAVDDTDWHQLSKDRFASELADILYKQGQVRQDHSGRTAEHSGRVASRDAQRGRGQGRGRNPQDADEPPHRRDREYREIDA